MHHSDAATPLLLEGARVLITHADSFEYRSASVCVADGLIQDIGTTANLRRRHPAAKRLRCRDRIIMPGLVNAHLHPDLHVLKGAVEQRDLHDWATSPLLNPAVDLMGGGDGRDLQRASIRASFAEAALSGSTCIGAYGVSDGALDTCADALHDLGLRGALVARDNSFSLHDGRVTRGASVFPVFYRMHAEETLTRAELELAAAAHRRGARIIMHAAETRHRAALARERFGTTTIRLLAEYDLLSPRTLLSHLTYIDEDEIALIAQRRAPAVFSAAAEMKLGDGTPPAIPLIRAGVAAALGSDAAVCSNATDMFIEMRAFGWQQKQRFGADAMTAEQILLLATRGGAEVLGLGAVTGRLEPGLAADLVLIDSHSPRIQPHLAAPEWNNIVSNIVFSATGSDVTDVMAAGRWIVRRRRLTMAPAAGIRRDLERAAQTLYGQLMQ